MKSFNDEFDIRLFSHLIETVLWSRMSKKANINRQITLVINKLQSQGRHDGLDLNFGIQMISKLHHGSDFKVISMLRKHFQTYETNKYCIYLQIFTLHNKNQSLLMTDNQAKDKLIQKWVFKNQNNRKISPPSRQLTRNQSDLIFKVLNFIKDQNESQNLDRINNTEFNYNTTVSKGYQLVIKSKCPNKNKNLIHVLHLEKHISQLEVHTKSLKSSLLQLPNFWQKSLSFYQERTFSVGCYFCKENAKNQNVKIEKVDSQIIGQPDRKMSSETKAEQKESTCSFKFSLENFSFRLSGNKAYKQSSDLQPVRKTSAQITNIHRPRYQSIYESKDEEMNIFILSPRKLSQEESPKIRHLQQKPIQFEITDQRGISEEEIEEFVLEPDEFTSNGSSEGFEMLEENDQLDSIREEKSQRVLQKEQKARKKELLSQVNKIESQLVYHLRSLDMKLVSF